MATFPIPDATPAKSTLDVDCTITCRAQDRAAAEEYASQFPGGSGTFSRPIGTDGAITHYAGSGHIHHAMVEAFEGRADIKAQPWLAHCTVIRNEGAGWDVLLKRKAITEAKAKAKGEDVTAATKGVKDFKFVEIAEPVKAVK